MSNKIYLATSWKNEHFERVRDALKEAGHEVYDFREKGFLFSKIPGSPQDPMDIPAKERRELLDHSMAETAFRTDMKGLQDSDVLVMLYPCGNDAHIELGWAAARGLFTIIYINEPYTVGLMDKVADRVVFTDQQLLEELR